MYVGIRQDRCKLMEVESGLLDRALESGLDHVQVFSRFRLRPTHAYIEVPEAQLDKLVRKLLYRR